MCVWKEEKTLGKAPIHAVVLTKKHRIRDYTDAGNSRSFASRFEGIGKVDFVQPVFNVASAEFHGATEREMRTEKTKPETR